MTSSKSGAGVNVYSLPDPTESSQIGFHGYGLMQGQSVVGISVKAPIATTTDAHPAIPHEVHLVLSTRAVDVASVRRHTLPLDGIGAQGVLIVEGDPNPSLKSDVAHVGDWRPLQVGETLYSDDAASSITAVPPGLAGALFYRAVRAPSEAAMQILLTTTGTVRLMTAGIWSGLSGPVPAVIRIGKCRGGSVNYQIGDVARRWSRPTPRPTTPNDVDTADIERNSTSIAPSD